MSRFHSYLNSSIAILESYSGQEPFASYIKKFFLNNKKYGSSDRKQVSHLCYCYFRTGKSLSNWNIEDRIIAGLFLCSDQKNLVLEAIKPGWNELVHLSASEKYAVINKEHVGNIFPWNDECSDGIEPEAFANSFLIQPDMFIRIRPGYENIVTEKLRDARIDHKVISESCISLPNASKMDVVLSINKEVVVQDYNSQRVGEFLKEFKSQFSGDKIRIWDCCAASGGKSIMAKDILGEIFLTVTDIRESILNNLRKRFAEASIRNYKSFVADLTKPDPKLSTEQYDLIIADVPCSGSGTWSRTPEQLFYFDKEKIDEYAVLQQKIVTNILNSLKPGGFFLYITCSVFKKENEQIVDLLEKEFGFEILKMELLKGYTIKADTMFAALLQKPL